MTTLDQTLAKALHELDQHQAELKSLLDTMKPAELLGLFVGATAGINDPDTTTVDRAVARAVMVGLLSTMTPAISEVSDSLRNDAKADPDSELGKLASSARSSGDRNELLRYLRARRGG